MTQKIIMPEAEPKSRDYKLESRISRTQNAVPEHGREKIEVYDLGLTARIPTEHHATSYFLYNLMGHETKAMLVSPTGGIAVEQYAKPLSEVEKDRNGGSYSGEGPNKRAYTREDTERFWLLRNPEFRGELVRAGWLFFPEITDDDKIPKDELEKFHIDTAFGEHTYRREFSLADLIKAIEITNNNGVDYQLLLKDLRELLPWAKTMEFAYPGARGSEFQTCFFHVPVHYKDTDLRLTLEGLEMLKAERTREKPNTMQRKVLRGFDFSSHSHDHYEVPEWWTMAMTNRVLALAQEYLEKQGTRYELYGRTKKEGVRIALIDRKYDEHVLEPDTKNLLDKAIATSQFVRSMIDAEYEEHEEKEKDILSKRKRKLQEASAK